MNVHFTLRVVQVHSQLRFCWFLFEKRGKYDNLFTPKTARKTCRYYLERSIFYSYPIFFPTNLNFYFSFDQSVSNLFCLILKSYVCLIAFKREYERSGRLFNPVVNISVWNFFQENKWALMIMASRN